MTRLNGPAFWLNPDLIERIEATPDTVVHLVGGTDYVITESVDEVIARVRESRAQVIALSRSDAVDERRREIEAIARRHAPRAIWIELAHRPTRFVSASGESACS